MSDQTKTDEEIKTRLNSIFPNPQVAARVVDLVVHNRPRGWSRKSNAPYYKEVYARQMQEEIDKMIANGNSLCFRYATWCDDENGMSHQTLYNRINQSIRYLVEQMDGPDGHYRKWYESVKVERERGIGVVISYIVGMSNARQFKAEEIEPRENMPIWKREMENWLESDSIRPFCKEGLALTPEEVAELSSTLEVLSNVQASITPTSVKIIRIAD